MRDSYREQLDDVLTDLVHMAQVVSSAVRSATTALLEADIHLAEQVIGDDELIDAQQSEIEARSFSLWPVKPLLPVSCGPSLRRYGW
jgi:phosphate transport system protein